MKDYRFTIARGIISTLSHSCDLSENMPVASLPNVAIPLKYSCFNTLPAAGELETRFFDLVQNSNNQVSGFFREWTRVNLSGFFSMAGIR